MSHPLVESTFAAARRQLRIARDHQTQRAERIAWAMALRAKAKALRAQLERLATDDTIPPPTEERATP